MSQSEYMESTLQDDIALKLVSSLQAFAKALQRNFIGVQLDGSQHVEPLHNCIPETTAKESAKLGVDKINLNQSLMEKTKICVTEGAGYIGSWLVKKLLDKGYIVHATLRSLDDTIKVGLLTSLPNADNGLVLFKADIYNPAKFEAAIEGCHFVFHVANPMLHTHNSQMLCQFQKPMRISVFFMIQMADSVCTQLEMKRQSLSFARSAPYNLGRKGFHTSTHMMLLLNLH